MNEISMILKIVFHLFMVFIAVYSAFAIFSLIRYGKSQTLGFLISVIYLFLVTGLYFQTLSLINSL